MSIKYQLVPPNGGWGFVIVIANIIIFIATVVPLGVFGIIFGTFLASIGDDTSGTTLVLSTYNTVSFFMGLVANVLLNKYSWRKVALLGAIIHFIGAICTIFVTKLGHLIFTFGIVEGIGFGLILPASLTAMNAYFDKKMALMMSICQTIVVVAYMIIPQVGIWSMVYFGYKGSVLLLAGLSLQDFVAALTLQPVEWHLEKKEINIEKNDVSTSTKNTTETKVLEPLINSNEKVVEYHDSLREARLETRELAIPLGERIGSLASITSKMTKDKNKSFWHSLLSSMDLHLLKDPKYLNICIGLALSFTGDIAFFPIIPSIMNNVGFTSSEIALMMSVFFSADLAARITLTLISAFFKVNSRYLVLGAAGLSGVLRIVLFLNDTLNWKLIILATLGYLRCFIQTPQALVISEGYPDKFASAYSLYMAVSGVVSLLFGQLMSFVKSFTNSDFWVCHILTAAFFVNFITWSMEMFICAKRKKENVNNDLNT